MNLGSQIHRNDERLAGNFLAVLLSRLLPCLTFFSRLPILRELRWATPGVFAVLGRV
jgi:hypothetical protein